MRIITSSSPLITSYNAIKLVTHFLHSFVNWLIYYLQRKLIAFIDKWIKFFSYKLLFFTFNSTPSSLGIRLIFIKWECKNILSLTRFSPKSSEELIIFAKWKDSDEGRNKIRLKFHLSSLINQYNNRKRKMYMYVICVDPKKTLVYFQSKYCH